MAYNEPWNKDEIVEALRPYFECGYSVNKACVLAEFPRTTFATWMKEDKELRQKIKSWQNLTSAKARRNLVNAIEKGDEGTSKWWLERREKNEFSTLTKTDLTSGGEKIATYDITTDQIRKVLDRKRRKEEARGKATGEAGGGSDGGTTDDGTSEA